MEPAVFLVAELYRERKISGYCKPGKFENNNILPLMAKATENVGKKRLHQKLLLKWLLWNRQI